LGLHLIALGSYFFPILAMLGHILLTVVALGMVIFVHELGHFLVAKACGVQCDKFYLGFDIGGLKLWKYQWGETEYGIGILPLGGYVKMLGQEDNPSRLREEIEQAKLQPPGTAAASDSAAAGGQPSQTDSALEAAQQALYNPRSYLAKSVPKRMAIISAGVIMNVIFAFVFAVIAYRVGVKEMAAAVGWIMPGEAAWRAGLHTGDQILKVGGKNTAQFLDLKVGVSLGDLQDGVPLVIHRPGESEPLTILVHPDTGLSGRPAPTIGIAPPQSMTLDDEPTVPGLPAAAAGKFKPLDQIVAVDGKAVENQLQWEAQLVTHADQPIRVTVLRKKEGDDGSLPNAPAERATIDVAPNPIRSLGLVMEMGEITAVQSGSPAEKAGLKPHDRFQWADDPTSPPDPMTLPNRLRQKAGQSITLSVQRDGDSLKAPLKVPVTLRNVDWLELPMTQNSAMPLPALGLTYQVLNRVQGVVPGSPAAKAGIPVGAVIERAVVYPPKEGEPGAKDSIKKVKVEFGDKGWSWPGLFYGLQNYMPGREVELFFEGGRSVRLRPAPVADWFNPERGFVFRPELVFLKASSFGEAVELGGRKTIDAMTMVVNVLRKLGTQISATSFAGPFKIFEVTYRASQEGITQLLLLLTMLSANLAVLNFLPIPVLDGGHMVFLAYEGIRRKPASEQVQLVLTYIGLVFILSLMIWVVGLDLWGYFFH
jgi:regulator of sigma E protease